jgi:hypothetical protein
MIRVTERAKQLLLEKKRLANIADPEVGLRLERSTQGELALSADRMKAGDQVVKHEDSTVLLVDAELSEMIFAGRTVDCAEREGRTGLVLRTSGAPLR